MKKLLLTTAAILAAATIAAKADGVINIQVQQDAQSPGTFLALGNHATLFNIATPNFLIDQITGSTTGNVVPPNVLDSNILSVDNLTATNDLLRISVTASNVSAAGAQSILSSFDNVGLTAGWTAQLTTFFSPTNALFGGTQLSQVNFSSTSNSQDLTSSHDLGAGPVSFTAEYIINTHDILGEANLGINIEAHPVPGPIVGAGLPGLIAGFFGLLGYARRRKRLA